MFRSLLALGLLGTTGWFSTHAGCPKPVPSVKITFVVILASEEGSTVDKRLKHIAEEIQKLNKTLKSFELKSMSDHSVSPGEKVALNTVDGKKAQIIIKHGADERNKVGLAITPPDGGEIVYNTVCGKFLPIVTSYKTKKNERLILAIRVQPCKGE